MEHPAITVQDVASGYDGLAAARLLVESMANAPRHRRHARRLAEQAAYNARMLRTMLQVVPDPFGHRPRLEEIIAGLEVVRAEARRFF